MLVLSRKVGETIMINDIKLTVVAINCNRVRLGFAAPQSTTILRQELVEPEDDDDDPYETEFGDPVGVVE